MFLIPEYILLLLSVKDCYNNIMLKRNRIRMNNNPIIEQLLLN